MSTFTCPNLRNFKFKYFVFIVQKSCEHFALSSIKFNDINEAKRVGATLMKSICKSQIGPKVTH